MVPFNPHINPDGTSLVSLFPWWENRSLGKFSEFTLLATCAARIGFKEIQLPWLYHEPRHPDAHSRILGIHWMHLAAYLFGFSLFRSSFICRFCDEKSGCKACLALLWYTWPEVGRPEGLPISGFLKGTSTSQGTPAVKHSLASFLTSQNTLVWS